MGETFVYSPKAKRISTGKVGSASSIPFWFHLQTEIVLQNARIHKPTELLIRGTPSTKRKTQMTEPHDTWQQFYRTVFSPFRPLPMYVKLFLSTKGWLNVYLEKPSQLLTSKVIIITKNGKKIYVTQDNKKDTRQRDQGTCSNKHVYISILFTNIYRTNDYS